MNKFLIVFCLICLATCNSCATSALWKSTDPNGYAIIKFTDISEEELQNKGSKYYKDDNTLSYYVNKNSYQKFKDYTYRVLGTPFTIVVDAAAIAIFAIGFGFGENLADDLNDRNPDSKSIDPYVPPPNVSTDDPYGPPPKQY